MNVLIPCSHCDRHVRSPEERCPFCNGALSPTATAQVARALVRSPSRAAAFALRTALIVTPALACGGDGAEERDAEGPAGNGGATTTSVTAGSAGAAQAGSSANSSGSAGALALEEEADAGVADAAFVPVPIYGGVFPDPVTRARV